MQKSSLLYVGLITAALILSTASKAAYQGPGTTPAAVTIADILNSPVEDQTVTLQGRLLKKTGKEEYLFSDGKDSITVEIDDKDLHPITVTANSVVEIVGEVDKKLLGKPEVEVITIRLITP